MLRFVKIMMKLLYYLVKLCQNWPSVLFSIYLTKKDTIYKMRDGTKFYVRKPPDLEAITENFALEWGHSYLSYFSINEDISTVIDVGAHIGTFTIKLARRYPEASFFCFEPDIVNFRTLQKNIGLNSLKNVKAFDIALGKREKEVPLYPKKNRDFGTMGSSTMIKSDKSIQVKCKTLSYVFSENKIQYCDILKLDCEGAEYDILLSQGEDCFNKIGNIILEYHEFDQTMNKKILSDYLKSYNFKVKTIPTSSNSGFIIARNYHQTRL